MAEQDLIDELEENVRLWESKALEALNPKTAEFLLRRAVRGRELAGRMRNEATAKAAELRIASRQGNLSAKLRTRPKL